MPYFHVPVTAYCTVLVEARDEDVALERAANEVAHGDFQVVNGGPAKELTVDEIARYRRHADVVLDPV